MDVASFATVAERNVIGSILIDPNTLAIAREIVKPEDFYHEVNRAVFRTMCELEDANASVNQATIFAKLATDPHLADCGGILYLTACSSETITASNIENYASIVRNDAIRLRLSEFGDRIKSVASSSLDDADATVATLGDELLNLSQASAVTPWCDFKQAGARTLELLSHGDGDIVPTGFVDLDDKLSGFRPGSLTIIAARPAMGKTALGLNIMQNAAFHCSIPTAFFSLEMTTEELALRTISNLGSVQGSDLHKKSIDEATWSKVLDATQRFSNSPIYIDETPGIEIATLRDRARRMHRQYGIKLIIIDYLQLMTCNSRKVQSREQEVSTISRGLKGIAKELHIPIIALAQISRNSESRADKRPLLCDLRESGAIEQDADNVLFIHREDYYRPGGEQTHEAEIIIAKQRSGPTGVVKLYWDGRYTRFSNLETRF